MITQKKLDEMRIRAQTKMLRLYEDWKLRYETGEWKEVSGDVSERSEAWQTTMSSRKATPGQV